MNPHLKMPIDLAEVVLYTFLWGILHVLLKMLLFGPVSVYLIAAPKQEFTKSDSAVEVEIKSIEKDSRLRCRKNLSTSVGEAEGDQTAQDQANQAILKSVKSLRGKFVTSAWRLTNFSITSVVGLMLLSQEYEWMLDPVLYFKDFDNQPMSPLLKLFYKIGYASYAYGSWTVLVEPKQKDFGAMVVHHLTTLFLIHSSFMSGLFRIGAVILLLHDISDPFMEIAKIFFYLNYKKVADVFFASFAVVFMITRNFIFPYYVIASLPKYAYYDDGTDIPHGKGYIRDSAFFALCILEVLHIYWAGLILKMIKLAITNSGVQGDIRNEDD